MSHDTAPDHGRTVMSRWTSFVLRHRALVALVWVAIAVAGAAKASDTVDALSTRFSLPGQPAYQTNTDIVAEFGGGGAYDPLLLVLRAPEGTSATAPGIAQEFQAAVQRVSAAVPGARIVTPADSPALTDGRVAVAVVYPPVSHGPQPYAPVLPELRHAVDAADVSGDLTLTGTPLLAQPAEHSGGDRGVLIETLIGAVGALVVLLLVFGSLLAALPLVIAAVSILGTFLSLLGLTYLTDVSVVVQYLVALIGLGVAIDYCLLIVMRWREEHARGADNQTSVRIAMETAGRSVAFSGLTVAVCLASLVLVPVPIVRSIGLGGLLIPLLSVGVSLSLLPALLSALGPRLHWPRRRYRSPVSRGWGRVARSVVRHRWGAGIASAVVLLGLAAPVLGITLGAPALSSYDADTPAARAAQTVIDSGVALGVFRPTEVLVDTGEAQEAVATLAGVEGVAAAVAPTGPGWTSGGHRLVQVWTAADPASDAGRTTLQRVLDTGVGRVGGSVAATAGFVEAAYGHAVWALIGVVVVTFLLLARALRSVWLPVKALVLNALSLGAAYGVTVLIWQYGLGTELLFGTEATGSLTVWVPLAAFAFLFGLSMDYEVFLLSRMRESYDSHGDTDTAVVDGIANTGRLVSSAALILFLAFVALATVPSTEVQILATTLALGIMIDALLVRGVLAPATVAILGHANWTMPRWVARVLRVRPEEPRQPEAHARSKEEQASPVTR